MGNLLDHQQLYRLGTAQFQWPPLSSLKGWNLWSSAVCLCKYMWQTLMEVG